MTVHYIHTGGAIRELDQAVYEPPLPDVPPIDTPTGSDLDAASGITLACAIGLSFFCGSAFGALLELVLR